MSDNPQDRGVKRDFSITSLKLAAGGSLQLPRVDTAVVSPSALVGRIVQDVSDQCLYHSKLTPGIGYDWVKIHDEGGSLIRTVTVGSDPAADYSNVQPAISDNVGKAPVLVVRVEDGDYDQDTAFSLDLGSLTTYLCIEAIVPFAGGGSSFIDDASPPASAGIGGVLSLAGGGTATVTVTGTAGDPNFMTLGVVAGDRLLAWDGATTNTSVFLTVASVLTNTITVTGLFPGGIGTTGNGFAIVPRVRLFNMASADIATGGESCFVKFSDLHFDMSRTADLELPPATTPTNLAPSSITFYSSKSLVEGGVRTIQGTRSKFENSTLIRSGGECISAADNADVDISSTAMIQDDVGFTTIFELNNNSRMTGEGFNVISVNGLVFVDNSSHLHNEKFFVVSKGTGGAGGRGLIELRRGSRMTGGTRHIEQLSDFAFGYNIFAITTSSTSLSVGTYVAPAGATATILSRNSRVHIDNAVIDKTGAGELLRAEDLGDIQVAACTTVTGGDLEGVGFAGGASGTTAVGAGALTGVAAGELGAGGPAAASRIAAG